MAAYLDLNPPARSQWYNQRNRPLTGCTVIHTAENIMDSVGVDTGAEAVADFIRRRDTAGSYHDLVDSDTGIYLVDYSHGAFHDGTGSNNWALSLSFACRTSDWRAMSAERRKGFLRQGALRFKAQQEWRRAHGYPATELRLISKAQSDAGASGFTYHGLRDPGRRSDPGVVAPNLFPFDEFVAACRAELADSPPPRKEFLMALSDAEQDKLAADVAALAHYIGTQQKPGNLAQFISQIPARTTTYVGRLLDGDDQAQAEAIADLVVAQLGDGEVSVETVKAAVRSVFADAAQGT